MPGSWLVGFGRGKAAYYCCHIILIIDRVEVSNFIICGDSSQAIVRYVDNDQGSSAMLPVSDLHPLHGQFTIVYLKRKRSEEEP